MQNKRIHCVGIKGIGLSALAQILAAQGHHITGSDVPESFPADAALRRAGIRVFRGFKTAHVPKRCELMIASNAYLPQQSENPKSEIRNPKQHRNQKFQNLKHSKLRFISNFDIRDSNLNVEIREALRRRIPVVSYPETVAEIFNSGQGIAVAGSHGKSTTSALLAVTLEALGRDPIALIGAVVKNWNSNARISANSKCQIANSESTKRHTPYAIRYTPFVLEADEYRNAFLSYRPKIAIVTSVDWDHPDIFKDPSHYRKAFRGFVRNVPRNGILILNGDDIAVRKLRKSTQSKNVITYGMRSGNILHIYDIRPQTSGILFRARFRKRSLGVFHVPLYGRHQALNAAAVIATCLTLDESPQRIRKALKTFQGTVRRFDVLTQKMAKSEWRIANSKRKTESNSPYAISHEPVIIDDYAHHPTEIAAVITATRETFPKRNIRILFQPHTFSRTRAFFKEFLSALRKADEITILKTYGSARERKTTSSKSRSEDLAHLLDARHFRTHHAALAYFQKSLRPRDVLLVMGAGDGDRLARTIAKAKKRG